MQKDDHVVSRRDFLRLAAATTALLTVDFSKIQALAVEMMPKKNLPVVVIGGGLGGLSAAAIFARNGFPVTLIEQHNRPGGYATTFDRGEGKFTFDVSLHATSTVKGGPMRTIFEQTGILNKVQMVSLPELCRIITPNHDLTWPQQNPEAIVQQLCRTFPEHSKGIKGFFDEMLGMLDEAMKLFDVDSWWDKLTFPITHRKMWAVRKLTLSDLLNKHVQDVMVRSVLSVFWGYYGLPPSKLSGFYYSIATAAIMRFGAHYVKRRSQDLSYALMDAIERAGGKVLLETEAEGTLMKGGAVSGVKLKDGSILKAKVVISNANVPATMKMLPRNPPLNTYSENAEKYVKKLKSYRPSLSTFIVWLGLNKEIREKIPSYEIFVNQHADAEDDYKGSLACDPEKSQLIITIYDNAYKGYSKPGTSTVTLLMLSGYEPWGPFEVDYLAGRKDEYRKKKEQITTKLIERAERLVIPGLRSMIEVKEAATPLTNLRYTKNPGGAIYGYEQSLDNAYMNRIKTNTPFKGLYIASAWGDPGGGYQPCLGSGLKAFQAFIKDWRG